MQKITLFLFSIVIVIFLFSCGNETKKTKTGNKQESVSDAYYWEHIFVKDDQCTDEDLQKCAHVLLDYPVFNGEQMENANKFVNHYIADVVGYGDVENPASVNLEAAANSLVKDYQEFHKEFPESPQVWHVRLKSNITYEQDELLCVMIVSETYMGGAHGALNKRCLNFNAKTGETVNIIDRVGDKEKFIALAEQKFRKQKNLSSDADLNETDYWFPNNEFVLPANIGIDDNGYLLHYNAYEIAPYSIGPTDIRIDFEELEPVN